MHLPKLGLVAVSSVLTVSVRDIPRRPGPPAPMARRTEHADLVSMSATGISPVPTSPSKLDLVRMELEKRVYIMPPNICGWLAEVESLALTCVDESASCINIGSYRNCCLGPTTDCAADFITQCLPATSLESNLLAESCTSDMLCCTEEEAPECGTLLFSLSTDNYFNTYTAFRCFDVSLGREYPMQDYPGTTGTDLSPNPDSTISSTPTPITTSSRTGSPSSSQLSPSSSSAAFSSAAGAAENSTPTTTAATTSKANPASAIAGGVVGGLAVIALCILGIFYIKHRQKNRPPPPTATAMGGDNNFMQYAPQSPPPPTTVGGGDTNSMHYTRQSPPYITAEHGFDRHSHVQTGYPQMDERISFLPPEMPGEVPRPTTEPTPDIEGTGTPVPAQTYAAPAVHDIHEDHGGDRRDRVEPA